MGQKDCSGLNRSFFLYLVRLRLGLHEDDIAVRAGLSQSQISRIMISWIDFLHATLHSCPTSIWPSRSCIDKTMPESFKQMHPSTHVVINCTKIFIKVLLILVNRIITLLKTTLVLAHLVLFFCV